MNSESAPGGEKGRQAGSSLGILAVFLGIAIVIIVIVLKYHNAGAPAPTSTPAVPIAAPAADQKPSDQAKPAADAVATEMEKSRAALAQLQAQLDKAIAQISDLQVQLDQSKKASDRLQLQIQSQADAAKAQAADLQGRLDESKSHSAELQAQLKLAISGSAELETQLGQSKARSADLQSRLTKSESDNAGLQPLAKKARRMPIRTSFDRPRGALLEAVGARKNVTLQIINLFQAPLSVDIAVTEGEDNRSQSITIAGGATLSIQKLQAGDRVVITSEGYEPVNLTVEPGESAGP